MQRCSWLVFMVFVLVAGACGRREDACATAVTRLLPFLSRDGQVVETGAVQALIRRCQQRSSGSAEDQLFRCVADAKDDESVAGCIQGVTSVASLLNPPPSDPRGESDHSAMMSEAELMLAKIKTSAKAAFNTDSSYPTVATELTPAVPCCDQPGRRCQVVAEDWATPAWQVLDVQMDAPFHFQYSYRGNATGTSYTAYAVGDPGCRGKPIKIVLQGSVHNGNPSSELRIER